MTKYNIVGIINIFLGIPQLLMAVIFPLSVFPKHVSLYSDFYLNATPDFTSGYVAASIMLLIAITNLFLGAKGFTEKKEKNKYFKLGIVSAITTFFVTGILVVILNISIIPPLYT